MATKSYSKHKEYREYSNSAGSPGYTDEQFDMIKADLLPKGSKLNSLDRTGGGTREYHYEYKEEKLPSGKYDRKDLHTVELVPKGCKLERASPGREYCYDYEDKRPGKYNRNDPNDMFAVEEFTVPPRTVPKSSETNTYYYEREEREMPAVNTGTRTYNYESSTSSTPGYSKVKTSKATKDLSHNVEELDSLLDDLQKDQERQLYKSGYTSDTAESTSFDYRKPTPIKAPSSGYSTLKREEHIEKSSWSSSPPPPPTVTRAAEVRQEVYREEKTESRVIPAQVSPAVPIAVPQPVCHHCHHVTNTNTGTLSRTSTPMNKVTTTVKTYTYEVPADQDPASVPIPTHPDTERTYLTSEENLRSSNTLSRSVGRTPSPSRLTVSPPPGAGCQYCSHCNTHIREYNTHVVSSTDVTDRTNERILYPKPANEVKLLPAEPHNGHGPHGPTTYKYSETSYSSSNTHEYPRGGPRGGLAPSPSPAPFPRPTTPSPGNQQTPKKLDDLLADFPEARFPSQPDGVSRRRVEVTHASQLAGPRDLSPKPASPASPTGPTIGSKNIAGPAVYYPPGHTPFAKKDAPLVAAGAGAGAGAGGGGGGYEASSAMSAGGGRYAAGRGMYEYESGARSKEKHSETKTAVPVCLPLCCAMPCVIM